jgi:Sulfotransferase family
MPLSTRNKGIGDWIGHGSYVDERRRLLYVETPKVASSSIKLMLRGLATTEPQRFTPLERASSMPMLIHVREQMPFPRLTDFSGKKRQDIMTGPGWFRFCVVRHPYDRFFSAWRDKIFITEPGFETYAPANGAKFVEFADFASRVVTEENPSNCDHHWRDQVSLLSPDAIAYSRIYDLGNISQLPQDLNKHFLDIDISTQELELTRNNEGWSIPSDGFLSIAIARNLRSFYKADFDRFGFSERETVSATSRSANHLVSEFTAAVFDRNRMIAIQSRCAQASQKRIRRLRRERKIVLIGLIMLGVILAGIAITASGDLDFAPKASWATTQLNYASGLSLQPSDSPAKGSKPSDRTGMTAPAG